MDNVRRALLSGVATLVLVSQFVQLLTFEDKVVLISGIVVVFVASFIFIEDMISLLKLNKN